MEFLEKPGAVRRGHAGPAVEEPDFPALRARRQFHLQFLPFGGILDRVVREIQNRLLERVAVQRRGKALRRAGHG